MWGLVRGEEVHVGLGGELNVGLWWEVKSIVGLAA